MYDSRDVAQNCQEDVDAEIRSKASLEKDSDGRKDNGEGNFADIATDEISLCIFVTRDLRQAMPVPHVRLARNEAGITVVAV